ncbi:hypothetical protein ACWGI8_08995 [Streptomyces sp. NPDC054841]
MGAVAATLVLVGCGGAATEATSQSHQASAPATATSSLPPTGKKSSEQVRSDFRHASESIGELVLPKSPAGQEACVVYAVGFSREVLSKLELLRVVSRLQDRGWRLKGSAESVKDGALLKHGVWDAMVEAGPVTDEVKAQAGTNRGIFMLSGFGKCAPS